MSEIAIDPLPSRCSSLFREPGIEESQPPARDLFFPPARDARGRFAKGCSGNPKGRPRGIRNPRRRVPDLRARSVRPEVLSDLIDRKPHLLRPLAMQVLPPPAVRDPAELLGIDLLSVRTADDARRALSRAWAAVGQGEIAIGEAAAIARRVRARLRALRRLARLQRRLRLTVGAESR